MPPRPPIPFPGDQNGEGGAYFYRHLGRPESEAAAAGDGQL